MEVKDLIASLEAENAHALATINKNEPVIAFLRQRLRVSELLNKSSKSKNDNNDQIFAGGGSHLHVPGSIAESYIHTLGGSQIHHVLPSSLSLKTVRRFLQEKPELPPLPNLSSEQLHAHIAAYGDGKKTLRSTVASLVMTFNGEEFGATEVLEALQQYKVDLPPDPRSRITTILGRMTEAGELERTVAGSGSLPNRYKVAARGANTESTDD